MHAALNIGTEKTEEEKKIKNKHINMGGDES